MGNFFTSLFSSSSTKEHTEETTQAKNEEKNFDILKYDGVRAHQMGKLGYAIKCYTEALAIKSDPETMNLLVTAYTAKGEVAKTITAVVTLVCSIQNP